MILVDLFRDVVESMRERGIITNSVETNGRYELSVVNTLNKMDVVTLDNVSYVIVSADSNGFIIDAVTGLDFTGVEYVSNAPYYLHGHPVEITNTLNERNRSGIYQYQKYPLIALLQEFDEVKSTTDTGLYSTANPNIVIVNFTEKHIKVDERYDKNFKQVLYPIYNKFLKAVNNNGNFRTIGNAVFDHTVREAPYYGEEGENGNVNNKFSDPLDAIKIINTSFKINDNRCNFLNK